MTERTYPVRVGGRQLALSGHAIEKYQERVRPGLDSDRVRAELDRVLRSAEVTCDRPAWVPLGGGERADGWLVLTDAIVFPMIAGRILTCLTRGEVGAEVRIMREQRRREDWDRAPVRGRRKKHGKVAREARRRARAAREEPME